MDKSEFLQKSGFQPMASAPVGADWSSRRFERLSISGGKTLICISSLPDAHPNAPKGHGIADFVTISAFLNKAGLSAPEVLAASPESGFLLVEDYGDVSLKEYASQSDANFINGYKTALDAILQAQAFYNANPIQLKNYHDGHIHQGRQRVMDWYGPLVTGQKVEKSQTQKFLSLLDDMAGDRQAIPNTFVHGDYHPENLMWLQGRASVKSCGIIDFQGAMVGPYVYDIVNLLDDARRILNPSIKQELLGYAKAKLPVGEQAQFDKYYTLYAFEFHSRIIGQAIKLALAGNARLLTLVPLLEDYMRRDLAEKPELAAFAAFFEGLGVKFTGFKPEMLEKAADLIAADAF